MPRQNAELLQQYEEERRLYCYEHGLSGQFMSNEVLAILKSK